MWNNYCANDHSYWFWPVECFIFLAVFFTVSRFFWWGVRYRRQGYWQGYGFRDRDPVQTAKGRYAAGKISKDELETIRRELEK